MVNFYFLQEAMAAAPFMLLALLIVVFFIIVALVIVIKNLKYMKKKQTESKNVNSKPEIIFVTGNFIIAGVLFVIAFVVLYKIFNITFD
jgi:heme/copper-type cytochrome/quinol oxidase subunit 2